MFGIYSGMFRRRRSASMSSLSRINGSPQVAADTEAGASPVPVNPAKAGARDDSSIVPRAKAMPLQKQMNGAAPHAPRPSGDKIRPARASNGVAKTAAASPAVEYTGMAAELDKMIHDHQRVKGTTQMMRATSGNMMMHRNLGNLNAGGASARSSLDRVGGSPKPAPTSNGYAFSGLGNIVGKAAAAPGDGLCRALSHRTDPEKLKELGNQEYREGNYAEAVALYDQAIIMDPTRPAYWGNKAAALAALGRLTEAVADCREAVRIDPSYARAHHRLGGLYLRYVLLPNLRT
jgi:DnaJ family protein C protein 7